MAHTATCSKIVPSMMMDAPLQSSMTGSRINARPLAASMGVSRSVAANAGCVTAAYAPVKSSKEKELEAKNIGELRALARGYGLRGDTKKELVALIIKALGGSSASPSAFAAAPSISSYAPMRSTTPTPTKAASSSDPFIASLEAKTIGELRQLGRAKGIRGDTKKELIKELAQAQGLTYAPSSRASTPQRAPAPVSYSRSVSPSPSYSSGPSAGSAAKAKELERKTLGELRALGRQRGIRGDTKKELVQLLSQL